MSLKLPLLLLCSIIQPMWLNAQDTLSALSHTTALADDYVGANIHFGYIPPHREEMKHLIQGHSYGFSASFMRKSNGKKYWHHAYNLPEYGMDALFNYSGNKDQLGYLLDIKYMLNLPLHRHREEWQYYSITKARHYRHWLGMGIGMAYNTKRWDMESNHQATVLGSHINAAITLQYSTCILQTSTFQWRAGLRVSHLSNGAFQIPNLGINNLSLMTGIYRKAHSRYISTETPVSNHTKGIKISAALSGGLKEIPPPTRKKFGIGVLSLLLDKRISYKSSFGAGLDVMYNSALQKQLSDNRGTTSVGKTTQAGAIFSYTLHFDQFEFKIQQGVYVKDTWKNDGVLYNRFGLRYWVNQKLFAAIMLKTHFAKADYIECGLGYLLHQKR